MNCGMMHAESLSVKFLPNDSFIQTIPVYLKDLIAYRSQLDYLWLLLKNQFKGYGFEIGGGFNSQNG